MINNGVFNVSGESVENVISTLLTIFPTWEREQTSSGYDVLWIDSNHTLGLTHQTSGTGVTSIYLYVNNALSASYCCSFETNEALSSIINYNISDDQKTIALSVHSSNISINNTPGFRLFISEDELGHPIGIMLSNASNVVNIYDATLCQSLTVIYPQTVNVSVQYCISRMLSPLSGSPIKNMYHTVFSPATLYAFRRISNDEGDVFIISGSSNGTNEIAMKIN